LYGEDYAGSGAACCGGVLYTLNPGEQGCCRDEDCANFDCSTWDPPYPGRKATCDPNTHKCRCGPCSTKGYPGRIATCDPNTHKCRCEPCESTVDDCKDGYCCDKELPGGSGQCREEGYVFNNKYLCDPVNGWVSQERSNPLDLFANLFKNLISFFNLS